MSYLKKLSSLKERALAQVAINICQDGGFKEVALSLEKPTYGFFMPLDKYETFVSDQKILSLWAKMKGAKTKHDAKDHYFSLKGIISEKNEVEHWNAAVHEQCLMLTEGLSWFFKHQVHVWMYCIALEYISYCRQQESLFGLSRYFLINFFTLGDWTEACQLDRNKLAERLIKNERLTVLQRYRIACVHCLHVDISNLWKKLSEEEKRALVGRGTPYSCWEKDNLVVLWSRYMNDYRDEMIFGALHDIWPLAVRQAAFYGNRAAVVSCWKRLNACIQEEMVIDMALQSVKKWRTVQICKDWFENFISNEVPVDDNDDLLFEESDRFNLPSVYSELVRFFLSEMNDEQLLIFFKEAFQDFFCNSVLECFVDWPHQDDFLPTINRLWDIVPMKSYSRCLLIITRKYSADYSRYSSLPSFYKKENNYYDYQVLLSKLWEETPEKYKRYLFFNKTSYITHYTEKAISYGDTFLLMLLKRTPFEEKDQILFKQVCCYKLERKKKLAVLYSEGGWNICLQLIKNEMWSSVNWLLEKCFAREVIPTFKKIFVQSNCIREFCLSELKENREKLLEDLIQWSFEFDTEKTQFKYELIDHTACLKICKSLLLKGEFIKMERMVNFCALSNEVKEKFMMKFINYTCDILLCNYDYREMDKILAWRFDTDDKLNGFKNTLFAHRGMDLHYSLVFVERNWKSVKRFYEWLSLSPEDIKNIKMKTVFSTKVINIINVMLRSEIRDELLEASLLWCLTSVEMIMRLKREIEIKCFERETKMKQMYLMRPEKAKDEEAKVYKLFSELDCLVNQLLIKLKENVPDEHPAKKKRNS